MFNIAICDDDLNTCSDIEKFILLYGKINNIDIWVNKFSKGCNLIKSIVIGEEYDIIFLDIKIYPYEFGSDIGNYIRNELNNQIVSIVYISSHTNYAMKLFASRPLDFLEKPVTEEKIEHIFNIFSKIKNTTDISFEIKNNKNVKRILYKNIIYFTSKARKLFVVTNEETFSCYRKLDDLNNIHGFIKIHKSFIININYVKEYRYKSIIMTNGDILPISQPYRTNMKLVIENL